MLLQRFWRFYLAKFFHQKFGGMKKKEYLYVNY